MWGDNGAISRSAVDEMWAVVREYGFCAWCGSKTVGDSSEHE